MSDMRAVAVLTALVLLLASVAAAQGDPDPSGSSSASSSTGPGPSEDGEHEGNETEDRDTEDSDQDEVQCPPDRRPSTPAEQRACFCGENPERPACGGDAPSDDEAAGEWRGWCRAESRDDALRQRCRAAVSEFGGSDGRHVAFGVDAPNRTLLEYRIDGALALEAVALDTGSGNLTVQRAGSSLRLGDLDSELVLHDDPTGLVRFKGDDGSVTLRFPASAGIVADSDGTAARIAYDGGRVGHLRAGNATWLDARTVLVAGFAAFLLPPAEPQAASGDADDGDGSDDAAEAQEAEEEVGRAIVQRKVGAEISVSAPAPAAASLLAGEDDGTVQVLAYDDVDVEVNVPSAAATPDAPIRVKVSAELDEGRTIVLNLDESVLESAKARSLVLRYYDLYEQPDGTEVQTEVLFHEADGGLQDILDPTDDSGQPEYWVVEDANGVQVLVSVPHWSAHAITIGSVLASHPSVLVGILVGLSGSAVAAAAMLWPRRRDD